jgi:hypothetical protein
MRFKSILLLFVVLLFANCKKEIPASIKLNVELENKLNRDLSRFYSIVVYKDGKTFRKFSQFEKPYIEKEIVLDSLSNGTYKFVYGNLLGQTMQKIIEVKENKVYDISIYPDYSNYKDFVSKSFVRNLAEGQKVEFYFKSLGCFHSDEDNLLVTKKDNSYFAERNGLSKKLNEKELEAIIKMECELNLIQNGGCTTSDHYIVRYGKEEKEFYDETCNWYGWTNLLKQIKLGK